MAAPRSKKPLITWPRVLRTGLVTLISLAGAFGLFAWGNSIVGNNLDEVRTAGENLMPLLNRLFDTAPCGRRPGSTSWASEPVPSRAVLEKWLRFRTSAPAEESRLPTV